METQNVDKALKALNGLSPQELELITKTISETKKRKVPFQKMTSIITSFENGDEMFFKDDDGNPHIGKIKKINQKFIRMYDERQKKIFHVLPENLRVATEEDKDAIEDSPIRKKRQYIRRKNVQRPQKLKKDEQGNIIYGRRAGD